MIFHASQFTQYIGDENAKLAAKIANELVGNTGVVIYGNHFDNGTCDNFSSTQNDHDTHVAIAIGLSVMGSLPVNNSPINVGKVTKEDLLRAAEERAERLENENKQLRGKKR